MTRETSKLVDELIADMIAQARRNANPPLYERMALGFCFFGSVTLFSFAVVQAVWMLLA